MSWCTITSRSVPSAVTDILIDSSTPHHGIQKVHSNYDTTKSSHQGFSYPITTQRCCCCLIAEAYAEILPIPIHHHPWPRLQSLKDSLLLQVQKYFYLPNSCLPSKNAATLVRRLHSTRHDSSSQLICIFNVCIKCLILTCFTFLNDVK